MGHKEHADEKAADAAMANPQDVDEDPGAVEDQPDAAKRGEAADDGDDDAG
jgi:hypothetical protein